MTARQIALCISCAGCLVLLCWLSRTYHYRRLSSLLDWLLTVYPLFMTALASSLSSLVPIPLSRNSTAKYSRAASGINSHNIRLSRYSTRRHMAALATAMLATTARTTAGAANAGEGERFELSRCRCSRRSVWQTSIPTGFFLPSDVPLLRWVRVSSESLCMSNE